MNGPLVTTAWLAEHLHEPDLAVLDTSWYLAASGRDPRAEYAAGHVPGAAFWDLDATSDARSPLPHTMPDVRTFAAHLGAHGVTADHRVVVYDGSGANLSAARLWWQLRAIGHRAVWVLDGGLGKWRAEGRALESGTVSRIPSVYTPRSTSTKGFASLEEVRRAGASGAQVLDARGRDRWAGTAPEPRPGIRSGHIPGSANLPYAELVGADGTLLPATAVADRFREAGIDLDRPVITSCGSGVSACALLLGLEAIGHEHHAVYDGSWTEWGGRHDTPVATGSGMPPQED